MARPNPSDLLPPRSNSLYGSSCSDFGKSKISRKLIDYSNTTSVESGPSNQHAFVPQGRQRVSPDDLQARLHRPKLGHSFESFLYQELQFTCSVPQETNHLERLAMGPRTPGP